MVQRNGTIFAESFSPRDGKASVPDPLPELLRESHEPLLIIQSVFPFTLFPDKIVVRVNHIDVVEGMFFGSATNTRLLLPDIRQVEVQFNPFFGTLEIFPLGPMEQLITIRYLKRSDAMLARRIIAGLMIAHKKRVDFSRYNHATLLHTMEELGTVRA
jgi:hypothetical protein